MSQENEEFVTVPKSLWLKIMTAIRADLKEQGQK